MLLANRGTDLSKDRVPELAPEEARVALSELGRSARATLAFLAEDAHIPHLSLLPYQQPLFALSRFFARHPIAHPRSRELLARWLWRGALTGAHNGSNVSTREMLAAIDGDEHRSIQALLQGLPPYPGVPDQLSDFAFSHARSKIELLALLELRPVDLRTGLPVLVDEPADDASVSEEDDEASPENPDDRIKRLVRPILPHSSGSFTKVANRMLHPGLRSGMVRAIDWLRLEMWRNGSRWWSSDLPLKSAGCVPPSRSKLPYRGQQMVNDPNDLSTLRKNPCQAPAIRSSGPDPEFMQRFRGIGACAAFCPAL